MVWFHPGAFSSGTSNEIETDGARLSRRGDVVVVTVNHRLNAFGYLYLAELGGDRSRRLRQRRACSIWCWRCEWVRDNIAEFGGDPGNVTDLRPVGRRREERHADGDAGGARACSIA